MSQPNYVALVDIAKVCVLTSYTLQTKYWPSHWGIIFESTATLPEFESARDFTAGVEGLPSWRRSV